MNETYKVLVREKMNETLNVVVNETYKVLVNERMNETFKV